MYVVNNLRKPVVPEETREDLRLFEVEHEPIAIVVVSGVVVIEFGRFFSFERSAEGFPIPVGDDVYAVGIGRRNQQQKRVLKDFARVCVLCGGELVSELHRHLRRDDLRRMNRARDRNYDFGGGDETITVELL